MKVMLIHLWCLCLLFTLFDGVVNDTSKPTVVNIGALVSFNSTIGKVAKIAIEEAVNDVNLNSSILHGTKLNLIMRDSFCDGFLGFIQGMKIMEEEVVAVIGPQSSTVSHIVSKLASELNVPLVSFSATDIYFTPWGAPSFVRISNSNLYQMTALADIISYFNWREVIVIFIDDDYGRNGVATLDDALSDRRSKIFYKALISPESHVTRSDVMDTLVNVALLESRVIVLHVTPDIGRLVFSVASYLGMMGNGYAWICTDWLSTYIDTNSPLPSEIMNMMQGVLALRQHAADSNAKRDFTSRWKRKYHGSIGLNVYGLYAYDSVWIIAHALEAFLSQGGNISFSIDSRLRSFLQESNLHLEAMHIFDGGHALLNNILQNNLLGLTGTLKFDKNRSRINPIYDIINVVGNGYREVGYWSNYSGLSIMSPENLNTSPGYHFSSNLPIRNVFWPDGSTIVPRGWVYANRSKQLRIGVPIRVGFKEFVSRVSGSNDMFEGFCIDVFQAAVKLLPYPVSYQFVGFGDGSKNPNYTDLVNMIATGNFDGAVGDIAIVRSRTKIADFTQPYAPSGLVAVGPFKEESPQPWAFLHPFSLGMWGVIILSFVAIGVVIWVLEHRINDDFRSSPGQQCITILWFSFSTLTFTQSLNTVSFLARAVLLIWFFVVLILTSSYTASLGSILTVQQLSHLRKCNGPIGYQVGSFAQNYLKDALNIPESRLVALNSPQEYADALRSGRVCSVVDEQPYIELFLSRYCDFRIVGQEFSRSGWGFAFPRDSLLAPDLSTAILQLSESGDLQRIHDKWLTRRICSKDDNDIESSQLRLGSFVGLFILCGFAFLIALAIYFTNICRRFLKISRPIGGSSSLRQLHTLKALIDEKKEPSKRRRKASEVEGLSFNDGGVEESL